MKNKKFKKLIVAIASSALFDLNESDNIFKEKGVLEYKKFQEKNINKILKPGVAFPFIKRLLNLNNIFRKDVPSGVVEVVLLSRNTHETGLRVFKSIQHYKLDIQKAGFFAGESPYKYIEAFNASLFLSANYEDVRLTLNEGYAAGMIIDNGSNSNVLEDDSDELRIAFDFDGVLANHESDEVFDRKGLDKYLINESKKSNNPLQPGPLKDFAKRIVELRKLESARIIKNEKYERVIKIALITARAAPAHERAVNTLKEWGIDVDLSFFMGDTPKKRILETMKPHIYFDDRPENFKDVEKIPSVFIPF